MNGNNLLVLLALNGRVVALLKSNGNILWSTSLPGMMGDRFITLSADDAHVYAFTRGKLHCLDLIKGNILWTNELKGFGYGIGSICVPGFPAAPDPSVYAKLQSDRRSSSSSDSPST